MPFRHQARPAGIREVDMEAEAIPELRDGGLTRRAVHDEDALVLRLRETADDRPADRA